MFDPTIGRWQTKDPKSFDAGDTNLYRYVGNHPSYPTDPSGLEEKGKLRSIPRSMLSELQEIHPPLPGETEADYLRAMGFVIQDLPEPVYDVKGKKILYPFSSERRGGFIDGVYYVDRWRTGNLEQPCVVCHGRDAFGLLPGLSTTDSFVGGAWYHSGSPGNIVGNQSAGVGSGIFNFFVGLGNIGGYGYQGLSGQDFEELIDSEAYTEWIRNAIYPDRDPGSLLTTSGEIFGQLVTGEVFGFALGSLISNSNKLNWIGAPSSGGKNLFWHGSAEGVENATKTGLFSHGTGNGSKFWATSRGEQGKLTEILIGGNYNIVAKPPFVQYKGGFGSVYKLMAEEASHFSKAWGFQYSWNPYQWYKGVSGQYYFHPGTVSWAQRATELKRGAAITTAIGVTTWGLVELNDWWNGR